MTAYFTGMRRADLLGDHRRFCEKPGLTWGEVDLDRRMIELPASRTKERRDRRIPVTDDLYQVLSELPSRFAGASEPATPVFLDEKGRPVRPERALRDWQQAVKQAGLPGRVRFHDLRHSFGSNLSDLGVDPVTIQRAMGHSKLDVTAGYIHTSDRRVFDAYARLTGTLAAQTNGKASSEA